MDIKKMFLEYQEQMKYNYKPRTNEHHLYMQNELFKAFDHLKIKKAKSIDLNMAYKILKYFKDHSKKCNDTLNKIFNYLKKVMNHFSVYTTIQKFPRLKVTPNPYLRFYHEDLKMIVQYLIAMNSNKNSICYKTALLLMLDSGARRSEIIHIQKKHIDFDSFPMRIYITQTKNSKPRYIPFSEFSEPFIRQLMASHDHESLFWNFRFDTPFTVECLKSFYRYTKNKLQLESFSSHRFRKSFASILAEKGMSIYDLQLLLDHSRTSTTQIYVQLKQDRGLASYSRYHGWLLN